MYNYIVGVYRKVGVSQYTRMAMKKVLVAVQKNDELIVALYGPVPATSQWYRTHGKLSTRVERLQANGSAN